MSSIRKGSHGLRKKPWLAVMGLAAGFLIALLSLTRILSAQEMSETSFIPAILSPQPLTKQLVISRIHWFDFRAENFRVRIYSLDDLDIVDYANIRQGDWVSFELEADTDYRYRGTTEYYISDWCSICTEISYSQLWEWVLDFHTDSKPGVFNLPEIDIYMPPLLEPPSGADVNLDQIGPTSPLEMRWTAKEGASEYVVELRRDSDFEKVWTSKRVTEPYVVFDGYGSDGVRIEPGNYVWVVGMTLPGGWWGWSPERKVDFTDGNSTFPDIDEDRELGK